MTVDRFKPVFGRPITGWYRWLAWHPVDTVDRGWRWLVPVWRRRISKPGHLAGPAHRWFQHVVDNGIPVCYVTEEWGGYFIGQRHCSVHDVKWESDTPCPKGAGHRMELRLTP